MWKFKCSSFLGSRFKNNLKSVFLIQIRKMHFFIFFQEYREKKKFKQNKHAYLIQLQLISDYCNKTFWKVGGDIICCDKIYEERGLVFSMYDNSINACILIFACYNLEFWKDISKFQSFVCIICWISVEYAN